jgi:Fe-S-cluster containining protein
MIPSDAQNLAISNLQKFFSDFTEIEKEFDSELAKLEFGLKKTCKKGCGACCHFAMIPVTLGEAYVFSQRLIADESFDLTRFLGHLKTYLETYVSFASQNGGLPILDEQEKTFLAQALPCPVFEKETPGKFSGHCKSYTNAPMICKSFHSLESPNLCATKSNHKCYTPVIQQGLNSTESLRVMEREHFGFSVIGHLPVLMGIVFSTPIENLFQFDPEDFDDSICDTEASKQSWKDFHMYTRFLLKLGYQMTATDYRNLSEAQEISNPPGQFTQK